MANVDITVRNKVEGEKEVAGLGKTLNNTLDTIVKSTAAVAAAGATFKKAFELAKEGANITQLGESFDTLNASVLHTPGLLEEMRAAVRGTVGDADLMQGVLKLTAGASDEMAQTLAGAIPQLLEISKAANKLNPTLGDTAFLYDSISTGIKRGSPLILDNLGIVVKVGEANEKYAESLGKTVEQLTAEEKQIALLNATLESGNQLIQQAGGNVDSAGDAYAQLEVQIGRLTGEFKQWLGEGLTPIVSVLGGAYTEAAEEAAEASRVLSGDIDELIARGQQLAEINMFGALITGQYNTVRNEVELTAEAIAMASANSKDFRDKSL